MDERDQLFKPIDQATFMNTLAKTVEVYQEVSGRTEEYQYDAAGNRTLLKVTLAQVSEYSSKYYANSDRLMTDGKYAFTYDAAGNLIKKGNKFRISGDTVTFATSGTGVVYWEYTYDLLNRLIKVTKNGTIVSEYQYDPTGLRVVKKSKRQTTHYVFEGTEPIFEKNIATGSIKSYVYAFGKHLARVDGVIGDATAKQYFYHTDHLGSINAITDQNGQVVKKSDYYAFGTGFNQTGSLEEDCGFTGKEFDSDIGLYYYNARWYDPELGRFISEDPAVDPNNPNLYSYCGNSPAGRIDPDGRVWWAFVGKIVAPLVTRWIYNAASDAAQQDGDFWHNFDDNLWNNPRTSVSGTFGNGGVNVGGQRTETKVDYDFDRDFNYYDVKAENGSGVSSGYLDFAENGWFEEGMEGDCDGDNCPLTPFVDDDDQKAILKAAIDFTKYYYDDTQKYKREFGSSIYEVNILKVYGRGNKETTINNKKYQIRNGKIVINGKGYKKYFAYTVPNRGDDQQVDPSKPANKSFRIVAWIHSHVDNAEFSAQADPFGDDPDFDGADYAWQRKHKQNQYLVGNDGSIWKWPYKLNGEGEVDNSNIYKVYHFNPKTIKQHDDPYTVHWAQSFGEWLIPYNP